RRPRFRHVRSKEDSDSSKRHGLRPPGEALSDDPLALLSLTTNALLSRLRTRRHVTRMVQAAVVVVKAGPSRQPRGRRLRPGRSLRDQAPRWHLAVLRVQLLFDLLQPLRDVWFLARPFAPLCSQLRWGRDSGLRVDRRRSFLSHGWLRNGRRFDRFDAGFRPGAVG